MSHLNYICTVQSKIIQIYYSYTGPENKPEISEEEKLISVCVKKRKIAESR